MLFFKTHSASSNNDSVEIVLSSLVSRAFLTAFKPSSCGILGYRPTTSIVQKIKSSGKGGRFAIFLKKSLVSFTYDLTFCANGFK